MITLVQDKTLDKKQPASSFIMLKSCLFCSFLFVMKGFIRDSKKVQPAFATLKKWPKKLIIECETLSYRKAKIFLDSFDFIYYLSAPDGGHVGKSAPWTAWF